MGIWLTRLVISLIVHKNFESSVDHNKVHSVTGSRADGRLVQKSLGCRTCQRELEVKWLFSMWSRWRCSAATQIC